MPWELSMAPHGANPGSEEGRNEGGMVVYLINRTDSGVAGKEEVGRVAWERQNSTHPDVEFNDQLDAYVERARHAIRVLAELTETAGELA